MRDGAAVTVGGGVSPSSDFTSWIVNGSAVRSSAIPSSELIPCSPALFEVWDHTALKCSGSGPLAGDSFNGIFREDLAQGAFE